MVAVVVTVAAGEIIKTKDIGNEFFNVQCYIFSCCELSIKVHLTPKLFFGRDETVQHSHKEFDNFISIWYF